VAGAAWVALASEPLMAETPAVYILAWTLMMTAMMLPSVAPLVTLYARSAKSRDYVLLVASYLGVWGATGVLAYAVDMNIDLSASLVLIAAAAYELTPVKHACLRRCRAPLDFLMFHWRAGSLGALRLGVGHALYCVGCCWALMAVLVLAAAMSVAWAAVLAAAIFAQKVLPAPRWTSLTTAAGLVLAAILVEVM
jgi:predicted metal-binding membrane protein